MPKSKRTHARTPAAALIAKAREWTAALPPPSPEAIEELRQLCEHNDSAPRAERVSGDAALNMLREHYGWAGTNRKTLDSLCSRVLGRKSYGTP